MAIIMNYAKEEIIKTNLRDSLEHIVNEFIIEKDYTRALEAQLMVIEETTQNIEEEYITLFNLLIMMEISYLSKVENNKK